MIEEWKLWDDNPLSTVLWCAALRRLSLANAQALRNEQTSLSHTLDHALQFPAFSFFLTLCAFTDGGLVLRGPGARGRPLPQAPEQAPILQ